MARSSHKPKLLSGGNPQIPTGVGDAPIQAYIAAIPDDWFLSVHCFTSLVRVAFFNGTTSRPMPPGASKQKRVRYLDIRQNDALDEKQFASWVKQANKLPGQKM